MKAVKNLTLILIAAFVLLMPVCPACAAKKTKAAHITLLMAGIPHETKDTFNFFCASGLKDAQREIGTKHITAGYFNALSDDTKLLPLVKKAAQESELLIITSKKYLPFLNDIEAEHSCKILCFFGCNEDVDEQDKHNILFREEEMGFLGAASAALLIASGDNYEDKTIGIIMGAETEANKRLLLGFRTGAYYIDEHIQTEYAYTQDIPAAEKALTEMCAKGANAVFLCVSDKSLLDICRKNKITAIVTDNALQKQAPETALVSIVKLPAYVIKSAVKKYMSRKLTDDFKLMVYARDKSESYAFGVSDYAIEISLWTPEAKKIIPPVTRKKIELIEAKLGYRLLKIQHVECAALGSAPNADEKKMK